MDDSASPEPDPNLWEAAVALYSVQTVNFGRWKTLRPPIRWLFDAECKWTRPLAKDSLMRICEVGSPASVGAFGVGSDSDLGSEAVTSSVSGTMR